MVENLKYMKYLKEEEPITTSDGKSIKVFHLDIQDEPEVFEEWAKKFRRNYCSDYELEKMAVAMKISPSQYLKDYKLPSDDSSIGRATMSGDFGEILVSDYLQYIEEYNVPRTRYDRKVNKDTSTQGSDVLAYKNDSSNPMNDELMVMEVKTSASMNRTFDAKNKLQLAIEHSNKDFERFSTSVVASYLRLIETDIPQANIVKRFLNITDEPFKVIYGAVAIHSNHSYDINVIKNVVAQNHRNQESLRLLVIHSFQLMDFISQIYRKASEL